METMCKDLEELREITEKMPSYNEFFYNEDRVMELKVPVGRALSVGVYSNLNISIAKTHFYPNTCVEKHCHPEREVDLVLEGSVLLTLYHPDGTVEERRLNQYDAVIIEPMTPHSVLFEKRTVAICNSLPFSPYYPGAGNGDDKES